MTQMERIERQTVKLILQDQFIGPALLSLEIVETKPNEMEMPTACTDGVRIKYDPGFIEKCSDEEVRGILSEETFHNLMGHTFRMGHYEDHETANKAADQELWGIMTQFINDCSGKGIVPYSLGPGAVYDKRWDGMSAEQIYAVMMREKKPGGNDNGKGPGGNDNGKGPGGGKGKGQGNPPPPQQRPGDFQKPAGTQAQQRKVEEDWKKRLQQAKLMGTLPAGMDRFAETILSPKVPWQEKLRHLINVVARDNYNWMKPNKSYLPLGLWLPSLHSERMGPAVIGQDTSGSMSEASISYGRTESMSVLECVRPEKLIVSDIDADVHSWTVYEPGDRISLKCSGGGGSDMRPLFDRIEKEGIEPSVCIIISDLCVCFPEKPPPYPVIWLTEEDTQAPFGETINIKQ